MEMTHKLFENIDRLFDMVNVEVEKVIKKGDLTATEVEALKKAFCMLTEAQKIKMNEKNEHEDSGYSGIRGRTMHTSHYRPGRYMSYGFDRPHTDKMGYSGHYDQDEMIQQLEEMYANAKTPEQRKMVEEWINQIER